MNTKIAPSILSADFANLERDIKRIEAAGADWVHVDVMDAVFVPNLTIGAPVVKCLRKTTTMPLDVHLMVSSPENLIPDFVQAGADIVTIHLESYAAGVLNLPKSISKQAVASQKYKFEEQINLDEINPSVEELKHMQEKALTTIQLIKSLGAKAGISLNPKSSVKFIEALLPELDLVLLMSVYPGFGGQKFMPLVYDKLKELSDTAQLQNRVLGTNFDRNELAISIDGGVIPGEIAERLKASGANVLVAGSAIYGAADMSTVIKDLKK